jgi:hypothetical protein
VELHHPRGADEEEAHQLERLMILAGPMLAAALTAQPPAYGPVACVYDALSPTQRKRLDVEAIDSPANVKLMEPAFESCGKKYDWPAELYLVVVEYTVHRIAGERARPGSPEQKKNLDEARRMEEAWARVVRD